MDKKKERTDKHVGRKKGNKQWFEMNNGHKEGG